ncbi:hypothetical protein BS78_03G262700 [Paspalum vaginatum]|nr:hypothetical protein BS78_03G262700 [Paspalum vaginatum]
MSPSGFCRWSSPGPSSRRRSRGRQVAFRGSSPATPSPIRPLLSAQDSPTASPGRGGLHFATSPRRHATRRREPAPLCFPSPLPRVPTRPQPLPPTPARRPPLHPALRVASLLEQGGARAQSIGSSALYQ